MNHTKSNVQSATNLCKRSTNQAQSSSKQKAFTAPTSSSTRRLTSTFVNVLPSLGTLQARSPQGFSASRLRIARVLAAVIGISLFLPMQQVSQASIVPTKSYKTYAKAKTSNHKQWVCLAKLWGKESAWNPYADNPHSTAFGIPQILGLKTHDPFKQIDLGLKYVKHRYSYPCKAWAFHKRNGWY